MQHAEWDGLWVQTAMTRAVEKIGLLSQSIGSEFVHASRGGTYDRIAPHGWTAGFWPGLLWLAYRETGNPSLRLLAETCERQLDPALDEFVKLHHDVGFIWTLASVSNYKLTGHSASRVRALKAATWLAGRFNVKGRFIRAWNDDTWPGGSGAGWSIIDTMMNLPLLFWASADTGDPRFKHIAAAHADTVLTHFIREDGSCRHLVAFDPETGDYKETLAGQGFAPESAWARGAAWALYGLALSFRYTGEARYLNAARRVAGFWLAELPEDGVPLWDFRLPEEARQTAPKDSSAAAIAASGLLLLAELTASPDGAVYAAAARQSAESLASRYAVWDLADEAMLRHGTGNHPAGKHIGAGLIYGDYFFVETLAKLCGRTDTFW